MDEFERFETLAVHAGEMADPETGALRQPPLASWGARLARGSSEGDVWPVGGSTVRVTCSSGSGQPRGAPSGARSTKDSDTWAPGSSGARMVNWK